MRFDVRSPGNLLPLLLLAAACQEVEPTTPLAPAFSKGGRNAGPDVHAVAKGAPADVMTMVNDVQVFQGGFGSGMAPVPGSSRSFYLLTDRGPNVDGTNSTTKLFPVPSYTPRIYKVHMSGKKLRIDGEIQLRRPDGSPLTGLPIPPGSCGSTLETARTMGGALIDPDPFGIDSEGIVALPDGTFWISDEYGPFLAHFAADGREIQRLSPCNGGLPEVFKFRRPNRGMEGLTITPDGQWLVGIMQAPLENPAPAGIRNTSRLTRILFRNINTGATRQYAYMLEDATLQGNSEIVALSATRFLVLERDGLFFFGAPPAAFKKIFEIDITGATDISAMGALGATPLAGGRTLEQGTAAEVLAVLTPVQKSLAIDLVELGYPHDKPEGLTIAPGGWLLLSNDDDFGVIPSVPGGGIAQKILPPTGQADFLSIWQIKLPK